MVLLYVYLYLPLLAKRPTRETVLKTRETVLKTRETVLKNTRAGARWRGGARGRSEVAR